MPVSDTSTFVTFNLDVTGDPKQITTTPTPFYTANFHVVDYDVYYGDGQRQDATAVADAVITFDRGNLADIFFKTVVGGSTPKIYCVATVPTNWLRRQLGI